MDGFLLDLYGSFGITTKIFGSIVSIVGSYVVIVKHRYMLRSQKRKELTAIVSFSKKLKIDANDFAIEKWYEMISGDRDVSAREINAIMSLELSSRAIRIYKNGKYCVDFINQQGGVCFKLKSKYASIAKRRILKAINFAMYFVLMGLSLAPVVFIGNFIKNGVAWLDIAILIVAVFACFFPMAYSFAIKSARINNGEELVAMSNKIQQAVQC